MRDPSPQSQPHSARVPMSRRSILAGGAVLLAGGGTLFASRWFNLSARAGQDGQLSVTQAHDAAATGKLVLIDIRRPEEWARTGIGAHAVPLDMRRKDFTEVLTRYVKENKATPVALICARGVRSRAMAARLNAAGFSHIIDVPEGMLGSGAGPGWLKTGLPVVPTK